MSERPGGAGNRPAPPAVAANPTNDDATGDRSTAEIIRSEETLDIDIERRPTAKVKARKVVESIPVEEIVPVEIEHADVEHVAAVEGDSGEVETLPDGSISIPILEEELVIEKRLVVRERVIVRKRVETEQRQVTADLARERVDVDVEDL
jgi:uncharacterized protein (TIGR02271 family)